MRRIKLTALVIGASLTLAGCGDSPKDVMSSFDADKMQYDIDTKTGLCFSVASVEVMDTMFRSQSQLSHSHVPCTGPVLDQIKKSRPGKLDHLSVAPVN